MCDGGCRFVLQLQNITSTLNSSFVPVPPVLCDMLTVIIAVWYLVSTGGMFVLGEEAWVH